MYPPLPSFAPAHIPPHVRSIRGPSVAREPAAKSEIKRDLRDRQREWLQQLVNATGKSASQIAVLSGVSDTTLTRLLHNPDYEGTLTQLTIDRIKDTMRVPGPAEAGGRRSEMLGFAEAEVLDEGAEPAAVMRVIKALLSARQSAVAWRIKTSALEAVGYLPGDLVIVDPHVNPQPQDVVCATVNDFRRGGAETVWRVFMPPYLIGASHDRTAYKPLLIDNDNVSIKGVVVESFRPHALSATR